MKKTFIHFALFVLLSMGIVLPGLGQPVLLKELSASSGSFVSSNGKLYYVSGGDSLWKSDGTPAGTVLVKKIGETNVQLTNLTIGSNFYFTTTESSGLQALWRSDGTAANTVKIASKSSVTPLRVFNNELYLAIKEAATGTELWKLSGSTLSIVKDINPGSGDGYVGELIPSGSSLYFVANAGSGGNNIWKTNGTTAGTVLAADVPFDNYEELTDVNGTIFFVRSFDRKAEIWKTNGTTAGTLLVKSYNMVDDPEAEFYSEYVSNLLSLNGKLYFHYNRYDGGLAVDYLGVSDGTSAGTSLVTEIQIDGHIYLFKKALNHIVLSGESQGFPGPLVKSDGTAAGTQDFGGYHGEVHDVVESGNMIFYANMVDDSYGYPSDFQGYQQLYQSDLTNGNTRPVASLYMGTSFSGTNNIVAANGKIFFTTKNDYYNASPTAKKFRLWYYDPTKPVVPVPYFVVVNTDDDLEIQVLRNDDIVTKPTGVNISIQYIPVGTPGSVVFKLNDVVRRTENTAPYLLAGDNNGDYSPWLEANPGTYKITGTQYASGGGQGTASTPVVAYFTLKNQNIPPTVNVGPDRTIYLPKDTVIINARAADSDGTIRTTDWSYSGPANLTLNQSGTTLYVQGLQEGVYTFRLWVADNGGGSASDEMTLTVIAPNTPPVVNAGADRLIEAPKDSVTLHASATDSDGTIQYIQWNFISGPSNPPYWQSDNDLHVLSLVDGEYLFEASATDDDWAVSKDQVKVTVRGSSVSYIVGYYLVNADTDADIRELKENDTLNLASLPPNLNIRVQTYPSTVGSVKIVYGSRSIVESTAPYALFGDNNGNYNSGNLTVSANQQSISATPYSLRNGGGTAGTTLIRHFHVIRNASMAAARQSDATTLSAFPNPSEEVFNFRFVNSGTTHVVAEIHTGDGAPVATVLDKDAGDGEVVEFKWNSAGVRPGVYYCKFISGSSNQTIRIVKK